MVGLLFLCSGRKVTVALRAFDINTRAVKSLTRWIMISGAAIIISTMGLLLTATPWFFHPVVFSLDFWIVFFTVNITSFAQTYALSRASTRKPRRKSKVSTMVQVGARAAKSSSGSHRKTNSSASASRQWSHNDKSLKRIVPPAK